MARARSADFSVQREAIVRNAARLFAELGYLGTSMNDIARACGISKALLYHYVTDKYQLLLEITDGHVSRLVALVAEIEARKLEPEQHLRSLIGRFVEEYAQAHHDHGVLTQDVKFLIPPDRDRVEDKQRQVVEAFARSISAARPDWQSGAASSTQQALAKPLTMLLFGMMNWLFTWLRPDGALSAREMAPIVADLFLGGLRAVVDPRQPARRRSTAIESTPGEPAVGMDSR